jgi:hypothetical protein
VQCNDSRSHSHILTNLKCKCRHFHGQSRKCRCVTASPATLTDTVCTNPMARFTHSSYSHISSTGTALRELYLYVPFLWRFEQWSGIDHLASWQDTVPNVNRTGERIEIERVSSFLKPQRCERAQATIYALTGLCMERYEGSKAKVH